MSELLPCPFCGKTNVSPAEGSTHRWAVLECNECGGSKGEVRKVDIAQPAGHPANMAALIADWNERAPSSEAAAAPARQCGSFACLASQRDGVLCADGECDIATGDRIGPAAAAPVASQPQQPVAWGAFHFAGPRAGKLYAHCDTEQGIKEYVAALHQSSDSLTLRIGPLYEGAAPVAIPSDMQTVFIYRLADGTTQVRAPSINDAALVIDMLEEGLRAMGEDGNAVQRQ